MSLVCELGFDRGFDYVEPMHDNSLLNNVFTNDNIYHDMNVDLDQLYANPWLFEEPEFPLPETLAAAGLGPALEDPESYWEQPTDMGGLMYPDGTAAQDIFVFDDFVNSEDGEAQDAVDPTELHHPGTPATEVDYQDPLSPTPSEESVHMFADITNSFALAQAADEAPAPILAFDTDALYCQAPIDASNDQNVPPSAAPTPSASAGPLYTTKKRNTKRKREEIEEALVKNEDADGDWKPVIAPPRRKRAKKAKAEPKPEREAILAKEVKGKIVVPEGRYVCLVADCMKTFADSRGRTRHMNSHFGNLFECPECQGTFCRSDALYRHCKSEDKSEAKTQAKGKGKALDGEQKPQKTRKDDQPRAKGRPREQNSTLPPLHDLPRPLRRPQEEIAAEAAQRKEPRDPRVCLAKVRAIHGKEGEETTEEVKKGHDNYDWALMCFAPTGQWFYERYYIEYVRNPPKNDPITRDLKKWRQLYGLPPLPK